jgi:hypothetical protein
MHKITRKLHYKIHECFGVIAIRWLSMWISAGNRNARVFPVPVCAIPTRSKPFYKSGDKSSPSNYRPISLLPVFSRIFKKLYIKDYLIL